MYPCLATTFICTDTTIMTTQNNQTAVVLVTYNRLKSLQRVVNNLQDQTQLPNQLVIVNNGSDDGTTDWLNNLQIPFPLKVINVPVNLGHGSALHTGVHWIIQQTQHISNIILLEDDTIAHNHCIEFLTTCLQQNSFDVIGTEGSKIKLGGYTPVRVESQQVQPTETVLLDGVIFKKSVFEKIGLPRSDFFMMMDDVEFAYRMKKNGVKVGVIDGGITEVLHYGGAAQNDKVVWRAYYQSRNRVLFTRVHLNIFTITDCIVWQIKYVKSCFFKKNTQLWLRFRWLGLWHGLLGKNGKTLDPKTLTWL